MNLERAEMILSTIDRLGIVSVRQLHEILKLGSYRNTCRVVNQLEEYLHVERGRQKIVYLNKEGRNLIGSSREVKKSALFDHMLLANEVFIHYGCPVTWKREHVITVRQKPVHTFQIQVQGLTIKNEVKLIVDAIFERNGYSYLIEIDNTLPMTENRKKIKKYLDLWPEIRKQFQNPRLCIFTKSEKRKKTFQEWIRNVPNEVYCFSEI